jgi:excisionase family DNA binding protein
MPSKSRHQPPTAVPSIPSSDEFVHLLTLAEAAERTGFTTTRLLEQVRHGNLCAYRVGDLYVFRLEELEHLVDLLSAAPTRTGSRRTAA